MSFCDFKRGQNEVLSVQTNAKLSLEEIRFCIKSCRLRDSSDLKRLDILGSSKETMTLVPRIES